MSTHAEKCETFLALHHGDTPLLLPNAWDRGHREAVRVHGLLRDRDDERRARGHARSARRRRHARTRSSNTPPRFPARSTSPSTSTSRTDSPTIPRRSPRMSRGSPRRAPRACRSRTSAGRDDDPIYDAAAAAARVEAAADAAHGSGARLVSDRALRELPARPPRSRPTRSRGCRRIRPPAPTCCTRPECRDLDDIRSLVAAVDLPINVLALPNTAPVAELGAAGVRRISVGGGFNRVALGATVDRGAGVPRTGNVRILGGRGRGRAHPRRFQLRPRAARQSCAIATAGAPLVSPAAEPWNGGPNVNTPPSPATNR